MKTPKNIVMMEDHDKAYHAWKERGVRSRTLVHVDAHIDFGWVPDVDMDEIGGSGTAANLSTVIARRPADGGTTKQSYQSLGKIASLAQMENKGSLAMTHEVRVPNYLINPFIKSRKKMVNIGNYICPAMREGIVDKFYWVVPDESLRSKKGLRHIKVQLKRLLKIEKRASDISIRKNCHCEERSDEAIYQPHAIDRLLRRDNRKAHPPRNDTEIIDSAPTLTCRLLGKEVIVCGLESLPRIDEPVLLDIDTDFLVTRRIWDDLSPKREPWIFPDELFKKLTARINDIDVLTISYSVEGGFTPLKFKYLGDDLKSLFEGGAPGGNGASTYFNLCLSHMKTDIEKARAYYNKAVSLDRTYATAYNNHGIIYMQKNRLKDAEEAYKNFLRLSGDDAKILNGLGYIALAEKRYAKAANFFERSLLADGKYREARFGKGIVAFKAGSLDEALGIFAGLKNDMPDEDRAYWWLGRIAEKQGEVREAIDSYKDAVMRGGDGPLVHMKLFRLYLIKGMYFRAFEELWRGIRMFRS